MLDSSFVDWLVPAIVLGSPLLLIAALMVFLPLALAWEERQRQRVLREGILCTGWLKNLHRGRVLALVRLPTGDRGFEIPAKGVTRAWLIDTIATGAPVRIRVLPDHSRAEIEPPI